MEESPREYEETHWFTARERLCAKIVEPGGLGEEEYYEKGGEEIRSERL